MERLGLSIILMFFAVSSVYSQGNYVIEPVAKNLNVPVRFAFAPDSSRRLFYLELLTGNIQVIDSNSAQYTWLHVNSDPRIERGLLGITFDPKYTTNHYVYIFYTELADTSANVVERYTEVHGMADTASRLRLFKQKVSTPCGIATNHNGGSVVFGYDGKLYISLGENACAELSALTIDPRGKILRIEPDIPAPYNAVPTNPFYDDGNPFTGNDDRIYAKGLRNPFGMTFSWIDSVMYVTENGPDCDDEIDRILPGRDYGWRQACLSGPLHCFCSQDSPYTKPLWTITPTIAPTGLIHYNGSLYPELFDNILFLDDNHGYIRAGTFNSARDSLIVTIISDPSLGSLYHIAVGPDGYIYFSHYDAIRRLRPLPTDVREGQTLPKTLLLQNVPNPFNPTTRIQYSLTSKQYVSLKIYNVLGEEIVTLADGVQDAGFKSLEWNATNFPNGVYFYRIVTGQYQKTNKMILMK